MPMSFMDPALKPRPTPTCANPGSLDGGFASRNTYQQVCGIQKSFEGGLALHTQISLPAFLLLKFLEKFHLIQKKCVPSFLFSDRYIAAFLVWNPSDCSLIVRFPVVISSCSLWLCLS